LKTVQKVPPIASDYPTVKLDKKTIELVRIQLKDTIREIKANISRDAIRVAADLFAKLTEDINHIRALKTPSREDKLLIHSFEDLHFELLANKVFYGDPADNKKFLESPKKEILLSLSLVLHEVLEIEEVGGCSDSVLSYLSSLCSFEGPSLDGGLRRGEGFHHGRKIDGVFFFLLGFFALVEGSTLLAVVADNSLNVFVFEI
jgi:hypothetical protein